MLKERGISFSFLAAKLFVTNYLINLRFYVMYGTFVFLTKQYKNCLLKII